MTFFTPPRRPPGRTGQSVRVPQVLGEVSILVFRVLNPSVGMRVLVHSSPLSAPRFSADSPIRSVGEPSAEARLFLRSPFPLPSQFVPRVPQPHSGFELSVY